MIGHFAFGEWNHTLTNTSFNKVENMDTNVRQRWYLTSGAQGYASAYLFEKHMRPIKKPASH